MTSPAAHLLVSSAIRLLLVSSSSTTTAAVSAKALHHIAVAQLMSTFVGAAMRTTAASRAVAMSFIVGVTEQLVLWLLRLVINVLHNRVRVVMVLIVQWHIDNVLLVFATSVSSGTAQHGEASNQGGADLKGINGRKNLIQSKKAFDDYQ